MKNSPAQQISTTDQEAPAAMTVDDFLEKLHSFISRLGEGTSKEISKKMKDLLMQSTNIHVHIEILTMAFRIAALCCDQEVIDAFMERTASLASDRERLFSVDIDGDYSAAFLVINNDDDVMRFIFNHTPKVNKVRDSSGKTLLMKAAEYMNVAAIIELVEKHGADVNAEDNEGNTALLYATDVGIAEILLSYGPWDGLAWAPLDRALMNDNIPLVQFFLNRNTFKDASERDKHAILNRATLGGASKEGIELLVNEGTNPFLFDPDTTDPIYYAAALGKTAIVKFLLSLCPKERIEQVKEEVLKAAVLEDRIETIKFILEQGVNVNSKDEQGRTPIFYTAASINDNGNKIKTAELLLEYGANVNIVDDQERSVLYYMSGHAMGSDDEEIQKLYAKFVERAVENDDGNSPNLTQKVSASSSSADNHTPLQKTTSSADNPPPSSTTKSRSSSTLQADLASRSKS